MNTTILKELREWAAVGFYESRQAGDPWPIPYGKAYRALYEHMDIAIPGDHLLMPFEPVEYARPRTTQTMDQMGQIGVNQILAPESITGMKFNAHMVAEKKKSFPQHAAFIDALAADFEEHYARHACHTHASPNVQRIVREGFSALEKELDGELAAADLSESQRTLLRGVKEYAEGVKAFHRRICQALNAAVANAGGARREKLARIADAFPTAFLLPAQSFVEGMLAINMTFMLDGCDSLGRIDQMLGPLFDADVAAGRLDLAFARELLDDLFVYFHRYNGWNIQIGGYVSEGKDGCNALTHECLLAAQRNRNSKPSLSFRITKHTPDDLLIEGLKTIRCGTGQPALYNDDAYMPALSNAGLGISEQDTFDLGFTGCTEIVINGATNCGAFHNRPEMNLARVPVHAVLNGFDPHTKRQTGSQTGLLESFATFDQFYAAVKCQVQWQTDHYAALFWQDYRDHCEKGDPQLQRTLLVDGCVRNRKSFIGGGARYNWAYVNYQGITNLFDSVAAVKHCVYDTKTVTPAELKVALMTNFAGREDVRRKLLAAPKFGNDDPAVDDLATDLIGFAWTAMRRHAAPRDGVFVPATIPWGLCYYFGKTTPATPDGRRAGEPLSDSIGAMPGCDTHGPTALLRSVAKLPLHLAVATPVLNLRVQRDLLASAAGLKLYAALIRSYFALGGMHLQISLLDSAAMKAAQHDPEKHRDLIVRIGGYSEYFVNLDPVFQDTIIKRTEHLC